MKKKRFGVVLIVFLFISIFVYLVSSFYMLHKKEVFYGKRGHKNQPITLHSEDDQYQMKIGEKLRSIEEGKWVKVVFADQKGVIIDITTTDKEQIPKEILQKIEGSE
ncbi:hypothetical protein CD118_10000 [Staphylococcus coagulans]|uniref:hypothetical protein n=1 Tax=Staphylococcus coagulans TaxID=74706 RepID=UPI000CD29433|nr:hypothetical protein [Staphylococcus coagulans]PNZ09910.1 hypothetical protein CD118_10000 [Staphylococcus coagulans]